MSEWHCDTGDNIAKELRLDDLAEVVKRLRSFGWDDDEIVQHRDYRAIMNEVWGNDD